MTNPPQNAVVFALALPLYVDAGAVHGIAVAAARAAEDMYYLVDNALLDGPPVWLAEGEVERCRVATLPVTADA